MNCMTGFFAELYMNSALFGLDGRGLSKNRILEWFRGA